MNREDFIIHVYCLICDEYDEISQEQPIRKAGFAPAFTDEEVITVEICGESFGLNKDEAIYDHFHSDYRHFFPKLPERSLFVRQAANLWQVKMRIQQKLVSRFGQDKVSVQVIDTLPMPMCVLTRARRDRCFRPDADYGFKMICWQALQEWQLATRALSTPSVNKNSPTNGLSSCSRQPVVIWLYNFHCPFNG